MEKAKSLACMDKIAKKLDNLELQYIMTSDRENILCKTYSSVSFNDNAVNGGTTNTPSTSTTCPHSSSGTCPHPVCKYPKAQCQYHMAKQMGNTYGVTEEVDASITLSTKLPECLFRITPTDIYNGIFLHVIKLHGEKCDLKMTFSYGDNGASELVNIIKFLVK